MKHTEETKEKLRKKRFEYLKNRNGDSAFERRNAGKMSYLEQWFFDNVIIKYNLLEKYDIVNEYPFYPYFIDFAFLNIKLAVELDGASHFKNGDKRLEHDLKKDRHLIENGWKLYRISYKENNEETIFDFIKKINNLKIFENKRLDKTLFKGSLKKLKIHRNQNQFFLEKKENYDKSQQQYLNKVLKSQIDFSKFGWVQEAAKIINQKPQKVNRWMKRFLPEFYEKQCFKRVA
ncbi:MAG: hypothetical protein JETCAE03_31850 [Ignavibacteriaceae bacterium]|nr:MAG: hypothetical protein JETCAE03_31850 [Ignavibacteriaceae bacterium]